MRCVCDVDPGFGALETGQVYKFAEATQLAVESQNPLLARYCVAYADATGLELPEAFNAAHTTMEKEVAVGGRLVWFDTDVPGVEADDPIATLERKIDRTVGQIERLERGESFIVFVTVPALNEENYIGNLIGSLRGEQTETPVVLVVADNNSEDATADIVRSSGGNIVHAVIAGVGPARQRALQHARAHNTVDDSRTIILQTDADCEIEPGFIEATVKEYADNPEMMVGVGPSIYVVPMDSGETVVLSSGKDYRALLGTHGMRECFELAGRDIADYLLEPPYRYLIGPNTTYRGSLFNDPDICYPCDGGLWEGIWLSAMIQQRVPSSTGIRYVPGQKMHVSSRAILGGQESLSRERLATIRDIGYVSMFNEGGVSTSPLGTIFSLVRDMEARLYGLRPDERVVSIIPRDKLNLAGKEQRIVPAMHAATGKLLTGRYAVIEKVDIVTADRGLNTAAIKSIL